MRQRRAKLNDLLRQAEQAEAAVLANLARCNALGEEFKALARERAGDPTAVELLEIEHRLRQIERERDRREVEVQQLAREATRARTAYGEAARRLREAEGTLERLEKHPERFNEYSRWQRQDIERRCNEIVKELGK